MADRTVLDISKRGDMAIKVEEGLRKRIVGQDEAIECLVSLVEEHAAGFSTSSRPIGNLLFLGPTGTGKTRVVEALAETLYGDDNMIKIDCAEFQHSHEIAKLVGSPPGYLGHRETNPMLTQALIDSFGSEKFKLCPILFDEIEKASDALWNLMLGIMDKATLTTGTNVRLYFQNCLIIMTSNLGAKQIEESTEGGLGFWNSMTAREEKNLHTIALEAARRKFTPEFMNRIDTVVTFNRLTPAHMADILDMELEIMKRHLINTCSRSLFCFNVTPSAKKVLLKDGFDKKYGARALKRALDRRIKRPLAHLVATGQINDGEIVTISEIGEPEFEFTKQPDLNLNLRLT